MTIPDNSLSRRRLLGLAACSLVAGCGGGSMSTSSLPGTGGTGMYALGSISGFGSVVVNGIRFDDLAASVEVDGVTALSTDLRLGMVASVEGTPGADATLGIASRIQTWSVAQGVITRVTPQSTGVQLVVAGMTIQADAATVLDGVASTASLVPGQRLAIWGLQADAGATHWRATRLALVAAGDAVTTGLLVKSAAPSATSLQVNGLTLLGADASGLAAGQLVRVQGTLSGSGAQLQVAAVRAQDVASQVPDQRSVELEGVVTALYTGSRFMLGGVMVDGSAQAGATALLKVGDRIEVRGDFVGGVLKATTIGLEDEQALSSVEIEARIEQFISVADFVVRSHRCDASGVGSIQNGTVASLKVGVKVHLKGTKAGDVLIVTELKIDD